MGSYNAVLYSLWTLGSSYERIGLEYGALDLPVYIRKSDDLSNFSQAMENDDNDALAFINMHESQRVTVTKTPYTLSQPPFVSRIRQAEHRRTTNIH